MIYVIAVPWDLNVAERKIVRRYRHRMKAFGFVVAILLLAWGVLAELYFQHKPVVPLAIAQMGTFIVAVGFVEVAMLRLGRKFAQLVANERAVEVTGGFTGVFLVLTQPLVDRLDDDQYSAYLNLQFRLLVEMQKCEEVLNRIINEKIKSKAEIDAYNVALGEILTLLKRGEEILKALLAT